MSVSMLKLFTVFFCVSSLGLYAQTTVVDNATGESFPREITIDHGGKTYQLQATGVSTRKKFFVKVYSVASYLQAGAAKAGGDIFSTIMQDNNAKQLTLKWVRDVDAARVQEGYKESFKNVQSDAETSKMQSNINTFTQWFNGDIKKGDEHIIRWLPGGYVEVLLNGKPVGNLTDPAFAKSLWSIWFGSKSVVDRNNLVSLVK